MNIVLLLCCFSQSNVSRVNGEGWDCTGMGDDSKVQDCFQFDRSKLCCTGVFEILIVLVGVCSEDTVGDCCSV